MPYTFPLFPDFPFEIRVQIWKNALPPPRLVHLREEAKHERWEEFHRILPAGPPGAARKGPYPPSPYETTNYIRGSSAVPSLLHTCIESRLVMQQHGYELTFSDPESGPRTWFNFDRDIVYLRKYRFSASLWTNHLRKDFCAVERSRVKRIAIQCSLVGSGRYPGDSSIANQTVRRMGSLEEILLVEGDFSGFGESVERFRDRADDPLVFIDCDVWGLRSRDGEEWEEGMEGLAEEVERYVEANGGDGSAYFREKVENMGASLRFSLERANADEEWSQRRGGKDRIEHGFYPSHYSIPRVRMVWAMTESCAKRYNEGRKATQLAASTLEL